MRLEVVPSIDTIDPAAWNRLVPETQLFNRHHFLSALEQSRVEDARMEYLLFWVDNQLVASAVLSTFRINLDLFISSSSLVHMIKRLLPGLFQIRVVFCGTPISAGHKNIYISDRLHSQKVAELSAEYLDRLCREKRIGYSIFKEFSPEDASVLGTLEKHGYFRANSLPSVEMELPFRSYSEYLAALRHPFRRQIVLSMKKIGSREPVFVENYFESVAQELHPVFTILTPAELGAEKFYQLYTSVMSRAAVKLEILNEAFFRSFFDACKEQIRILAMVFNGKILGVFLLGRVGCELTFIWTGKDFHRDEHDTYANLMNAMMYYAISEKCSRVVMGQTSYYPKQRMGGVPFPLFIFFKSHRKWNHSLLKLLNSVIFPETKTNQLKVFKHDFYSREHEG